MHVGTGTRCGKLIALANTGSANIRKLPLTISPGLFLDLFAQASAHTLDQKSNQCIYLALPLLLSYSLLDSSYVEL